MRADPPVRASGPRSRRHLAWWVADWIGWKQAAADSGLEPVTHGDGGEDGDLRVHAVEAGATPERPVLNQHGSRMGSLVDPWGHRWSTVSPEKPDRV